MVLLSIIIPAYNAEKYIQETIESALSQTIDDYEIIIVNDGSTDKTNDIIVRYENIPNVVLKGYTYNRGAPHAYNHGLLHSQGKYVVFLDADDVFLPAYCKSVIELMENTGADIGYANLAVLEGTVRTGSTLYGIPRDPRFQNIFGGPDRSFPNDMNQLRRLVLQGVHISPRSIYKRSLFLDFGLEDHRLKITHDWLRHIKFMLYGAKCVFINEPLGYYRIHSEGNSQKDGLANYVENIKLMEIILYEHGALLSPDERNIVMQVLKQMRVMVFQLLADSTMTTLQIVEYLTDKKF